MRYEAHIRAYDCLDQVVIVGVVQDTSVPAPERAANLYKWSTTIAGEGEADPAAWLREALVGLLETL